MTVLSSMNSGVSGLKAESDALSVTGDNIANVNTSGFKAQRAVFEDVLGHSILAGTSTGLPGSGVKVGDVQQMFTQGTLSNTGVSTDVALNGDGFFVVKGTVDGVSSNFFTRAGEFAIDKDGKLTNTAGLKVQGYQANGDGTFAASLSDVSAPTAALPARATTAINITANIDSSAPVIAAAWDPQDPANTANFSTTMSVFDSLGNAHTADVYFRKTADNAWDYHVLVPGADLNPPVVGNSEIGSGALTFTTNGALDTETVTTAVSATFGGGATAAQAITLDFGTSVAEGGTGLDGTTQFAGPSNVSSQKQDGYASGTEAGDRGSPRLSGASSRLAGETSPKKPSPAGACSDG
jgi:flagellar hook protein FlgE